MGWFWQSRHSASESELAQKEGDANLARMTQLETQLAFFRQAASESNAREQEFRTKWVAAATQARAEAVQEAERAAIAEAALGKLQQQFQEIRDEAANAIDQAVVFESKALTLEKARDDLVKEVTEVRADVARFSERAKAAETNMQEFEALCKKLQKGIEEAQAEAASADSEVARVVQRAESAEVKAAAASTEAACAVERALSAEKKTHSLQEALAGLEMQLGKVQAGAVADAEAAAAHQASLQKDVAMANTQFLNAQEDILMLRTSQANLQRELDSNMQTIQDAHARYDSIKRELDDAHSWEDILKKEVAQLKDRASHMKAEVMRAAARAEAADETAISLRDVAEKLRNELKFKSKELADLETARIALKVGPIEQSAESVGNEEVARMQQETAEEAKQAMRRALEAEHAEAAARDGERLARQRCSSLEAEKFALEAEVARAKSTAVAAEQNTVQSQEQLVTSNQEVLELRQARDNLQHIVDQLHAKETHLDGEMSQLRNKLETAALAKHQDEELRAELNFLRDRVKELRERVDAAECDKAIRAKGTVDLEAQIKAAALRQQNLENELIHHRDAARRFKDMMGVNVEDATNTLFASSTKAGGSKPADKSCPVSRESDSAAKRTIELEAEIKRLEARLESATRLEELLGTDLAGAANILCPGAAVAKAKASSKTPSKTPPTKKQRTGGA